MAKSRKNENEDLKKELKKKKEHFRDFAKKKKEKLISKKRKIRKKKHKELTESVHEYEKELFEVRQKKRKFMEALGKARDKVTGFYDKQIDKLESEAQKREKEIIDEAEKKLEKAEKLHDKELNAVRQELISLEKRVYSRRRKISNAIQFAILLYLFFAGVVFLKDGVSGFSKELIEYIAVNTSNPLYGFGFGWLGSIIAQSASLIAILANTLAGSGAIASYALVFILLGLLIGNSSTPVLVSLFTKSKARWDLRHGFELGLANIIYNCCLVAIGLIIELGFQGFSRLDAFIASSVGDTQIFVSIPDLLDIIVVPFNRLIDFAGFSGNTGVEFILGIAFLFVSLDRLGRNVFVFLGGRRYVRSMIEKQLSNYWKAFFIGLILTLIIPSASLLVSLLVPLAVARIVTLRQAIPYIIGTNVGTFIDVLLASFAIGSPHSVSGGLVLSIISAFGVFFIIKGAGVNMIYKSTRYLAIHVIGKKKRSIFKVLFLFTLVPTIIILLGYLIS